MSVQLAAQDFTTPNKGSGFPLAGTTAAMSAKPSPHFKSVTPGDAATAAASASGVSGITVATAATTTLLAAKVTPHLTSATMNTVAGKHVRFGAAAAAADQDDGKDSSPESATTSSSSKRGLVSRRGGRFVSPGRPPAVPSNSSVTATPTAAPTTTTTAPATTKEGAFRTPATGDDSSPALCSTNSVGLVSIPSECENTSTKDDGTPPRGGAGQQMMSVGTAARAAALPIKLGATTTTTAGGVASSTHRQQGGSSSVTTSNRPSSISVASINAMVITSPLASKSSPKKDMLSFDDADSKSYVRSPVPSTSYSDRFKKTPTKSPSHFQSLPSLDDPKLNSPMGFILSPGGPNTPSYKTMREAFEKESKDDKDDNSLSGDKIRDYTKEKFALTPTNFSVDYGKSSGINFDTSNVLNWLQSPTANGLFSPGGLNSIMNTPKGPLVPRTPGTPTISTSFFFSDVAGLPRNGDTPKRGDSETAKSPKKGLSNIICISPLASSRNRGTANAANTPINYNDIFASPNPLLDDSPPTKSGLLKRPANGKSGSKNDPSLDAMHNAERDLMQDEDLSVLLQLAGGNTPKGAAERSALGKAPGGHVFRAGSRKGDDPSDRENLPGLQLPIIGDREGDSSAARLARKTHARDPTEKDTFVKPTLGIRKSSSKDSAPASTHPGQVYHDEPKPNTVTSKSTISKPVTTGAHPYPTHSSHPYPPRPPTSDMYSGYTSMPPHGMRPSGRMSVVVGGPPPSSRASKAAPAPPRSHITPAHRRPSYSSQDSSYPPPGMSYPPPPPGHYPPPHPVHMGAHPYHSHYAPPPRHGHHAPPTSHMPMYGAQHHKAPSTTSKISPAKKSKTSKATKQQQQQQQQQTQQKQAPRPPPLTQHRHHHQPPPAQHAPHAPQSSAGATAKRPSIGSDSGKPTKKARKSPGSKKKKSPQLTDKGDRQRAAQTIAAVNAASGGKNDKAAALAAAILRGVTMRPSGKWQAQLYFAGKSRYIGVFDTREKAALAYEIAREKLKSEKSAADGALTPKQTENAVNAARKAAFDGVNEKDPRLAGN